MNRPGLDVASRFEAGIVRFQTNADGLLPGGARRERPAGVRRILLIGDSTVLGRSVPEDERLHAQLKRELERLGGPAEVLNAAVEGYGTDQSLLRLEALLPVYQPDVVIYGFCDNDPDENLAAESAEQGKPHFERTADGALREQPPRLKPAIVPYAAGDPRHWLQSSAFYRTLQPALRRLRERLRASAPPAEDTSLMHWDRGALEARDWALVRALLERMRRSAEAAGASLLVFAHPALLEVWPPYAEESLRRLGVRPEVFDAQAVHRRLARAAAQAGVPFCASIERFLAQQARGPFHLLPRDPHCNGTGYAVTAEALAACLAAARTPRGPAR